MNDHMRRIQVTAEQMERMLHVLEDLTERVLPQNPELYAVLLESPVIQLEELLAEQQELIRDAIEESAETRPSPVATATQASN